MSPGSLLGLHTSVGGFSGRSGRKEDSHARQHIASVGNMDARGRVLFVGNEPNHPLRMWLMNGDGTAQCSVTPGGIELEVGECTNGDDLCRAGAWCDGADVDGRTSKRHFSELVFTSHANDLPHLHLSTIRWEHTASLQFAGEPRFLHFCGCQVISLRDAG
jgi:hypothetical protein